MAPCPGDPRCGRARAPRTRPAGALAPKDAVATARAAVALDPTHAPWHFNLASALQDAGDFAGAVAAYRRAAELTPDATTFSNLAGCCMATGDLAGAVAAMRRAVELEPNNADWQYNYGACLCDAGDLAGAAAAWAKAAALNPRDVTVWRDLALVRAETGDFDGAQAAQRTADQLEHTLEAVYR